MFAGPDRFLAIAEAAQWDDRELDLEADAAAWRRLEDPTRTRVARLVAGFAVAEASVAEHLRPFLSAAEPAAAACFRMQFGDEVRHARFFDRVAEEVLGIAGATREDRRRILRRLLDPAFLGLFESRLPEVAADVGTSDDAFKRGVGLYHLALEGIVFSAGQRALLEVLAVQPGLSGVRRGVERVLRDERWHVGFGACVLQAAVGEESLRDWILAEGDRAVAAWPSALTPQLRASISEQHRRRVAVLAAHAPANRPSAQESGIRAPALVIPQLG
jgi:ribonucleoside-diphosphate reductase beta chain